jgi:hypothetical protein
MQEQSQAISDLRNDVARLDAKLTDSIARLEARVSDSIARLDDKSRANSSGWSACW